MTAVQESSVEKFGAVHAKVQEGNNEQETTRGASLRELLHFFEKYDKDKGYAGLRRIADHEDGTAVWTVLKETEVAEQLEKRARERREEEQRHEKILETLRAELQAAREKVASLEAKA